MEISDREYFQLSSNFNYILSGDPVNWEGVLNLMLSDGNTVVSKDTLVESLAYLGTAYGDRKRRLGPFSLLHPLRCAYILNKSHSNPTDLDFMTALLHDLREDILSADEWRALDEHATSLKRLDVDSRKRLIARLDVLTKRDGEAYYEYLGRVLRSPDEGVIAIKLIDRLDNTLDLRIDIAEEENNSYQLIFNALFCSSYKGLKFKSSHPSATRIRGSERLYQLFKNAILLSLCRQCCKRSEETYLRLFSSLTVASLNEAMNILVHLFTYHLRDPHDQRELLHEVLSYSEQGGLDGITVPRSHTLDGLFCRLGHENRRQALDEIYKDKRLMALAATAFMVIFSNFLNDPGFRLHGITPEGLFPGKEA